MFKNASSRVLKDINIEELQLASDLNNPNSLARASMFYLELDDMSGRIRHEEHAYEDASHNYVSDTNSLGYRSPEFGSVDLITLGCSQTFGLGVCSENIWPSLLAKKLNMSHANLGFIGWSVNKSVDAFYAYVYKYGAPKAVALLMPDLNRITYPLRNGFVTHNKSEAVVGSLSVGEVTVNSQDKKTHTTTKWTEKNTPILSKRPHLLGDVTTPEVPILQAFQAINRLLVFCKVANIAVSVDSWHYHTVKVLDDLDYLSDEILGLTALDVLKNNNNTIKSVEGLNYKLEYCQLESHAGTNIEHNEYHCGTDGHSTSGRANHMGAHQHMHHADSAYEALTKQLTKG